ncbi:MAG TPA: rRNA maturation RNase YbeY [Nitrospiraceae bacterium]|jgi:rRNA maturation RNase YbeY
MAVLVRSQLRRATIDHPRLRRLAQAILSSVGEPSSVLSVALIGDRSMRRLNQQYRKKAQTTDVLAFSMREGRGLSSAFMGDVIISVPTAMKQARRLGRSVDDELVTLLVHGILHLCGYDHERSKRDARRMQRRERMVLRRLGRIPRLVNRTH